MKGLSKACFIAMNYSEAEMQEHQSCGMFSFDEWNQMYFDYLIMMYNGIIQQLDFKIDVVYPMEYLAKAIPENVPSRDNILAMSCYIALEGEGWLQMINNSLFYHPRRLAVQLFDEATLSINQLSYRPDGIDCLS